MLVRWFSFALASAGALALNFDYENIQLTEVETRNYSAIQFGSTARPSPRKECRAIPGDADWPSDAEWDLFNKTLGGALLKPVPLASACYAGPLYDAARCASLRRGWSSMNLHSNDPISVMSQWSSGNTCVPTSAPNSTCTQGGYPVYVVNATSVRHIQMAVNFARNKNIRLVVKNSGHDFNGRSIGGNALSVWVHSLTGFHYHANYSTSEYNGRAIAIAAGFRAMDSYGPAAQYNFSMISAGGATVGLAGGFFQGGGHSGYTSYYGMAADHVLSINAVTANGKLVTADPDNNEDLYWAFRGGGAGTYGIVTSVVFAVFPQTPIASGSITFSTIPRTGQNTTGLSLETFWAGVKAYWEHCIAICDNGGLGYNFIRHGNNPGSNGTGLTFTTSISFPNRSLAEYRNITRPLLQKLNQVGIPIGIPAVKRSHNYYAQDEPASVVRRAVGDTVGYTRIASRFFQRSNYDNADSLQEMHLAIRDFVEKGGYDLHGINYSPTMEVSGNPDNAVNPAFRDTIMHAEGYDSKAWWDGSALVEPVAAEKANHDRLQQYMQKWRDITPGSGSYINEGDAQEPDWKSSFFGSNYPRLWAIKRRWDPEGVFWAISTVGSDAWEVRNSTGGGRSGVYTQDGRLCRVRGSASEI